MNKYKQLLIVVLTNYTLTSTIISLSPAVCFLVKDADKTSWNVSWKGLQKQPDNLSKSQLSTQIQVKRNKQKSFSLSVQNSLMQIQIGCTAKMYWVDNKKTYNVAIDAEGRGFFVIQHGYAVTNLLLVLVLPYQIVQLCYFSAKKSL